MPKDVQEKQYEKITLMVPKAIMDEITRQAQLYWRDPKRQILMTLTEKYTKPSNDQNQ